MYKMISINQCTQGGLYRLDSRNLSIGVWNKEKEGFIGIRTKWSSRYLDIEFHWDTGPPHGTAKPTQYLEDTPENIGVYHTTEPTDRDTGRQVVFDMNVVTDEVEEGAKIGKWMFVEPMDGDDRLKIYPQVSGNPELFAWLEDRLKEYDA